MIGRMSILFFCFVGVFFRCVVDTINITDIFSSISPTEAKFSGVVFAAAVRIQACSLVVLARVSAVAV